MNNEKSISEILRIQSIGNQLIYGDTVPNQNDGKTIEFILNPDNSEYLSFEKSNHGFSKKLNTKE